MRTRRVATMLATAGLSLGLIGGGLSATFTDGGTVTQNIEVGSFGIALTSDTAGAEVSANGRSITYTAPIIMSSAPGTAPLSFTVASTGDIPVLVEVTQSTLAAPWSSLLEEPVADVVLMEGQSHTYAAGLAWGELSNDERGQSVTISYTITASEVPTP